MAFRIIPLQTTHRRATDLPRVLYNRIGQERGPYSSQQTFHTNYGENKSSKPTSYEIGFHLLALMNILTSCAGTPIPQLNLKNYMPLAISTINAYKSPAPPPEEICNPAHTIVASWEWIATSVLSEILYLSSIKFAWFEITNYISYQIPIFRQ